MQQALDFAGQLVLLRLRDGRGPGIADGRIGVVGLRIKILVVEGDIAKFPVHRKAVSIGRKALFLDIVLQQEAPAAGIAQRVPDGLFQLVRSVYAADALAARTVHGLDHLRPGQAVLLFQGRFHGIIAADPGDPKAVLAQKAAKACLVLQDADGFIGADIRQAQLFGHIGGRHYARVAGKGHDAVHAEVPGQPFCRLKVGDADVVILVRIAVGDVVRQIVAGDRIQAKFLCLADDRQQIPGPAQQEQFFHFTTPLVKARSRLSAFARKGR